MVKAFTAAILIRKATAISTNYSHWNQSAGMHNCFCLQQTICTFK